MSELGAHEVGNGLHGPAVIHELPEQRAEDKYREELGDKSCGAAHEGLRPVGEQGFTRERRSEQRDSRREEKYAPAAEREPNQ